MLKSFREVLNMYCFYETILGSLTSNHILKGAGQTNQLEVIGDGQTFDLYINERFVGSIKDEVTARQLHLRLS